MRFYSTIRADKKFFSAVFIVACQLLSLQLWAQSESVSPYSRYGLGDIPFNGFVKNIGMGGTGIAMRPNFNINVANPASYSSLLLTSFDIGASASFTKMSTLSLSQKKSEATFSYFALAFPVVSKKWGAALGLIPFSNVGYKIVSPEIGDNNTPVTFTYEGTGGVNRFFIGNAFTIMKNFSAGFNASYLFGTLDRIKTANYGGNFFYNSRFTSSTLIRDFYFDFGLQYVFDSIPHYAKNDTTNIKVPSDWSLAFGLTGSLPTNISASQDLLEERYQSNGSFIINRDTVLNVEGDKGVIKLPYSVGFGITLKKGNRWLIAADATLQNWQDYSYLGQKDSLRNSMRISLGTQYTPDERGPKSYWQTMQYRLGTFYNQTYLQLKGSKLNEYGVTAGLGFPIRKGFSMLQLSTMLGTRGTTDNNLIKEDFVRVSIGVTFSDRWFIKPKFD
jgi:hypothetical protein